MKPTQIIYRLALIAAMAVVLFAGLSCSGDGEELTINYIQAVEKISSSATGVTVRSYATGDEAEISREKPEYSTIFSYIENAAYNRSQPRYHEIGGKTEEIGIPYVLNYTLIFNFSEGPDILIDYGYDKIWFTSKDMIYGAEVDLSLDEVLEQLTEQ